MSELRQSYVIGLEAPVDQGGYAKGLGADNKYIVPPPGTHFSFTLNASTTQITAAGSKTWEDIAYGQYTGSFEWRFVMSYKYLEPFILLFEGYKSAADATDNNGDTPPFTLKHNLHHHTFRKLNNKRVPSFVVQQKILNRIAGGTEDQIIEHLGCVARNIRWSKASQDSKIDVTVTGFFADQCMYKGNLDATDYVAKNNGADLIEYLCAFADKGTSDTVNAEYMKYVDSFNCSMENGVSGVYSICSPVAVNYAESRTSYQYGISMYAIVPKQLQQRLYSGGRHGMAYRPQIKNRQPMKEMHLYSYDKSCSDNRIDDITDAFTASEQKMEILLADAVVKTMTLPMADGSKIADNISSQECKMMSFDVVVENNDSSKYDMSANSVNAISSYKQFGVMLWPNGGTFKMLADGADLKSYSVITDLTGKADLSEIVEGDQKTVQVTPPSGLELKGWKVKPDDEEETLIAAGTTSADLSARGNNVHLMAVYGDPPNTTE